MWKMFDLIVRRETTQSCIWNSKYSMLQETLVKWISVRFFAKAASLNTPLLDGRTRVNDSIHAGVTAEHRVGWGPLHLASRVLRVVVLSNVNSPADVFLV